MMKKLSILLCISVSFMICGCTNIDINEVLLQREDISITINGELQMSYDEGTCQLGYNREKNEFRVIEDNVGNWFVMTCNKKPASIGQEVTATLSWTTSSSTETLKGLDFTVKNIDERGYIWLWCGSESIGVVIREL